MFTKFVVALALLFVGVSSALAQSTVTANIHNACGWQPSTSYTYSAGPPSGHFVRVNNGAGWSPSGGAFSTYPCASTVTGGTYTAGAALNNYQLDVSSPVPCTSASSGGPTTTGSLIHDGTCIWNYVGPVDYISISSWGFDNGVIWTTGTTYGYMDVVHTTDPNLPDFQLENAGCTSTVKPTTANANTTLSDGCFWTGGMFWAQSADDTFSQHYIYYSSNANFMPMVTMNRDTFLGTISSGSNQLCVTTPPATYALTVGQYINWIGTPVPQTAFDTTWGTGIVGVTITGGPGATCSGSGTTWTISNNATANVTNGTFFVADEQHGIFGNSYHFNVGLVWNDKEYVSGQDGESYAIMMWGHNYQYNDGLHGVLPLSAVTAAGYGWGYPTTLKAAPGEGFQDTFAANSGLALAGYNANYGVAIRGVGVEGFGPADNQLIITGLQISSNNAAAIFHENRAGNGTVMNHNILEGGSNNTNDLNAIVANSGFGEYWYDNLIIANGYIGLEMDYGGWVYNNTLVCPAGTCLSPLDTTINWQNNNGSTINGNLAFGFQHFLTSNFYGNQHFWTTCGWDCEGVQGTNNATDVASTDGVNWDTACSSGGTFLIPCTGYSFTTGYGTSYAIPFKTGYTYSNSTANPPATTVNLCTATYTGAPNAFYPVNPGVCQVTFGLSPSSVFVSWPGNYKINTSSSAYGAGASFATIPMCTGTASLCTLNATTPDIIGTSRPQGSRFDAGAFELLGAAGSGFGGRTFR